MSDPDTRTTPDRTSAPEPDSVAARLIAAGDAHRQAIAVRAGAEAIGYGDLLRRADGVSRALRTQVAPDRPIVVQVGLSAEAVVLVVAVLLSGRPLVAVDPRLPAARVGAIVDELARNGRRAGLLIADADHVDAAHTAAHGRGLTVATAGEALAHRDTVLGRATNSGPPHGDPARQPVTSIQFTSGSTGTPKGVLHPDAMWICDAEMMAADFDIATGRRVALCLPISFGAGLNVLIAALLNGAEVLAVDPRDTPPADLLRQLAAAGPETMFLTPSLLRALLGAAPADPAAPAVLDSLRRVITTGEPLTGEIASAALRHAPRATVTNWVGSSETSALASFDVHPGDRLPPGPLPAGRPARGKRIDVDTDGRVVVTSPYLALGYLDPDEDAGRFIRSATGETRFVSGDRGTWDGAVLRLRGRVDDAVKIRGYLVEPAEIEEALLRDGDLREALVVPRSTPSGQIELVAYVVPDGRTRTPPTSRLRARLGERLPAWMVPAHIVELSDLPRTTRGKIDRPALPAPIRSTTPPRHGLERAIADVWAEALALDHVGRDENIYALGADSLTVQQILANLTRRLGITLSQSEAASAPTVADVAALLAARRDPAVEPDHRLAPTTVPLRTAPGRPVFCFTGVGASALAFVPLADALGDVDGVGSVYAFQQNGLDNRGVPDWTVAAAARRHLNQLRRIQPRGPYVLIGHSLGGFVALDLARRLLAAGEEVERVVVLDTFVPPRLASVARRTTPELAVTAERPPFSRRELWRRRLRVPLAGITRHSPVEDAAALEEVGVRVGHLHRPKPYAGAVLLFVGNENGDDPRIWRDHIATGDLVVHGIDCDHISILREPYIGDVVATISEVLDRSGSTEAGADATGSAERRTSEVIESGPVGPSPPRRDGPSRATRTT